MRINIPTTFTMVNQINKHTVKIYDQRTYTQTIIKNYYEKFHNYIKKNKYKNVFMFC